MKTLLKYIIAALIAFAVSTISAGATASEDDEYEVQPTVQIPTARNLTIETAEPKVRRAVPVIRGVAKETFWLADNREMIEAFFQIAHIGREVFPEVNSIDLFPAFLLKMMGDKVSKGEFFEVLNAPSEQNGGPSVVLIKTENGGMGWVVSGYLLEVSEPVK